MTTGFVRVSCSALVRGVFPPQGVTGNQRNVVVPLSASQALGYTYGTSSGQVDILVSQDKTLAATTAYTYDLYTGTDLKNLIGETAAFRKVKFVGVYVVSGGDASGVRVGGATSNEWVGFFAAAGDKYDLFPSGVPFLGASPAGKAVGATTCNFRLESLAAVNTTVRVVIAGTSV